MIPRSVRVSEAPSYGQAWGCRGWDGRGGRPRQSEQDYHNASYGILLGGGMRLLHPDFLDDS